MKAADRPSHPQCFVNLKTHFKQKFDNLLDPVGHTLSLHSRDMYAHSLHENMQRKASFNAEKALRAILSI